MDTVSPAVLGLALTFAENELRHLEEIDTDLLDGYAYRLWNEAVEAWKESIALLKDQLG